MTELDDLRNENKRLREEVELWKRSYHASERRLIERGKTIDELISQNSESHK